MTEETLFAAALEKTLAPARQAFLDEACPGEVTLRQRVRRLLQAHERPRGILDRLDDSPDPGGSRSEDPPPLERKGARVAGRYSLLEMIGEGGQGTVWLAEQTHPVRRKVALKIIKAGFASRTIRARFQAERQALALMDHPNIAKVHDGDTTDDGRPFFVMEYVEGVPITQHCDDARLSIPERLELFVTVCQAVQHAHTKGIIHRDLKPSNVLVARYDGEPVAKVIDFGVAKATGPKPAEWTTLTHYGQLIGTPLYMSPEQAGLDSLDVDARCDIYALGSLLYELLTGSTPFVWKQEGAATLDQMLRSIRECEPQKPSSRLATTKDRASVAECRGTDPSRLRRVVRGDLDWIVMKALEKDRTRRYETANDLATDLRHYLQHQPVTASPPSVGLRLQKFVRRHRGPVVAAASVVLALVAGMIGTTWGMIRATEALEAARRSERDANDQLFVTLLNRARAGRASRQMGQRRDSLDAVAQAARIRPDERLRDEAIAAMALPDVTPVPIGRVAPPGTLAVTYGGQYRVYARAEERGEITVRRVADGVEVRRIHSDSIVPRYRLYFSADEQFLLAFGKGRELLVWRVADGRPVLRDRLRGCGTHVFSRDGRRLAVGQTDWVLVLDLETGREILRWRLPAPACTLEFDPKDTTLAVGYSSSTVASIYDATTGALVTDLPVGAMTDQVVAWNPDGDRLAVAGSDPRIQVWEVAARRQVGTLAGHVSQVSALTFHPDGTLLASYSWDGALRLWDPASGRSILQLPLAVDGRPRFSRDGRWLAAVRRGEQAELLEVTPSPEYRTLTSSAGMGRGGYNQADFSPDGRLLAVGMNDGTRIWDLERGRELAALHPGSVHAYFDRAAPGDEGSSPGCPPTAALLTSGAGGILRWPIASDDRQGRRLRLLVPRQLSSRERAWFSRSPDGKALGVATVVGGPNTILDLATGAVERELGPHPSGEVRALSGDGRWAASWGWHSDRVWLWNLRTGRRVHEWAGKRGDVFFTPDSRALVIARSDEFSFWDVETLQVIRRLPREYDQHPGSVAFSPDRRLMALEMAPGVLCLIDVASGRTVARFEDPYGDRATWQGFTPDGTRLVAISGYSSAVHVWDLRAIRKRLKAMHLDWSWPEFPPARTDAPVARPLSLAALPFELAQRRAIELWRRGVEDYPDSAYACNGLAWILLTAPESLRDVEAALPLAEKAVRLEAGVPKYRNTLGVAYYRAGRYRETTETLRPKLSSEEDRGLACGLYFLAMSHHRLGESARARDYYDWAVRWSAVHGDLRADQLQELFAIRAEAEKVLGITGRD